MITRLLRSVIIGTTLSIFWLSGCTENKMQNLSKVTSVNDSATASTGDLQNNPVKRSQESVPIKSNTQSESSLSSKEIKSNEGNNNVPALQSSKSEQTETVAQPSIDSSTDSTVITGEFIWSWNNPLDYGSASVVKKGTNTYHLSVNVVTMFSHHNGSIEGDFYVDGKNMVFIDPEYKDVKLLFSDNSLSVDYPGNDFGGANAEPKGTYYLPQELNYFYV